MINRLIVDDQFGYPPRVHQAYERYTRNQRLMLNIMSESAVPDTRTVVTVTQLHDRKRQVGGDYNLNERSTGRLSTVSSEKVER